MVYGNNNHNNLFGGEYSTDLIPVNILDSENNITLAIGELWINQ
ncbi:hypothetical protein [Methanobrevibacter arboriphilus]|nr:hypothetical protein [Methanobrevibacter arboriphilus]